MTQPTAVQTVENWLAENSQRFSALGKAISARSMWPDDPVKGKVVIAIETSNHLGSVTYWNKGDVTAIVIDRATGTEKIIDDRHLRADENAALLLERYVGSFWGRNKSKNNVCFLFALCYFPLRRFQQESAPATCRHGKTCHPEPIR